jgi:hypothetical protein
MTVSYDDTRTLMMLLAAKSKDPPLVFTVLLRSFYNCLLCLSVHLLRCISICLSVYIHISVYISIFPYLYIFLYLYVFGAIGTILCGRPTTNPIVNSKRAYEVGVVFPWHSSFSCSSINKLVSECLKWSESAELKLQRLTCMMLLPLNRYLEYVHPLLPLMLMNHYNNASDHATNGNGNGNANVAKNENGTMTLEQANTASILYLGGFMWNKQAQEHGTKLAYLIHLARNNGRLQLLGR